MARGFWAYCRVSTKKDEQELSLDEQERWARDHAAHAGEEITVFRERASAKSTLGRPEFQRMVASLQELPAAKRPRAIIATALDRLSRDMTDMLVVARTMRTLKVELYIRDVGPVRADTFAERAALVGQSMGGEAENEARSNRIRAMWDRRRREGKPPTNKTPYGVQLQAERDVPIPESAEWVLRAFEWYSQGVGSYTIAQRFKGVAAPHVIRLAKVGPDGEPIRRTRHPVWEGNRIAKMLRQPRYRGLIVPEDLFDRVQALLDERPRWRRDRVMEYPMSGAVKCGKCGRGLCGRSTRPPRYRKKGLIDKPCPPAVRYRYYFCTVCCYAIAAHDLEHWFRRDVARVAGDPELLTRWIAGEQGDTREAGLRREIATLERATEPAAVDAARGRVWDLALAGQHASADLERQLARIAAQATADRARLAELRTSLERRVTSQRTIAEAKALLSNFWLEYNRAPYESKKMMMGLLTSALGGCTATKDGLTWTQEPTILRDAS